MLVQYNADCWQGRVDSESDRLSFRLHQIVKLTTLAELEKQDGQGPVFGLIGFRCDEGVRRNKGVPGAAKGPEAIRKALANLPGHLPADAEVYDFGDILCEGTEMEAAQAELGNAVSALLGKNVIPIILGGGHETFYGHYLGARQAAGGSARLGLVNIDAHFDMRPYEEQPSSGTMFKQILDEDPRAGYFVAGIQKQGNTAALFAEAKKHGVAYVLEEDLLPGRMEKTMRQLEEFVSGHDALVLTLCTDAISSAYAPGVSAPSPFGLEPKAIRELIRTLAGNSKLLSFDVCEVNPDLDEQNRTAALAARLVHEFMMAWK
ncbi:formimidoylglutamase [Bacillus sp. FJAT-27251]|uniref:formimidoylglutamase n=1 Tax=Bacillus sp. FJAT-27251 TaxID=1684142 RepID=UPI0006A764F7|nr:formimidoylglutamase [Bacillus sp. FJAT-27251]